MKKLFLIIFTILSISIYSNDFFKLLSINEVKYDLTGDTLSITINNESKEYFISYWTTTIKQRSDLIPDFIKYIYIDTLLIKVDKSENFKEKSIIEQQNNIKKIMRD